MIINIWININIPYWAGSTFLFSDSLWQEVVELHIPLDLSGCLTE